MSLKPISLTETEQVAAFHRFVKGSEALQACDILCFREGASESESLTTSGQVQGQVCAHLQSGCCQNTRPHQRC